MKRQPGGAGASKRAVSRLSSKRSAPRNEFPTASFTVYGLGSPVGYVTCTLKSDGGWVLGSKVFTDREGHQACNLLLWLGDLLGDPQMPKDEIVNQLWKRYGGRRSTTVDDGSWEPIWNSREISLMSDALFASRDPYEYVIRRVCSPEVLRASQMGWDARAARLTLPLFDQLGRAVAGKRRRPVDGVNWRNLRGSGRPWPLLMPIVPAEGWCLMCAGEFDALRALAEGLPAVSVTQGAGKWRPEWGMALRTAGVETVVVAFDVSVNERRFARDRVGDLRAAGLRGRVLDLRDLGLRRKGADLSNFFEQGGTKRRLMRAIKTSAAER